MNEERRIELIYADDCPNAGAAREELRQALLQTGRPPRWIEWERNSPDAPAHARRYGSPTVLIDGRDIAGLPPSGGADCCRVYRGAGGFRGAPGVPQIVAALSPVPESGTSVRTEEV